MKNPLSHFFKWVHYVLLEESSDPHAPSFKHRRQLHNAFLIQVWATLIGIGSIASIPVIVWLITTPYFVISYLIWCAVMAITNVILKVYVKRLNKRDEYREYRTTSDSGRELAESSAIR